MPTIKRVFIAYAYMLLLMGNSLIAQDVMNVDLLYNAFDESIELNFRDSRYSEVWGFTYNQREYGVIGSTEGLILYDVSNPNATFEVDRVPGAVQGYWANHRDYHDYNGYLYTVGDQDDNDAGILCTFQIIDMQYLPDSLSLVYDSNELFNKAHNIFIDTATAKLYACGTTHPDGSTHGLEIYSLEDPTNPQLLTYFDDLGYVHDTYVRNDTAYLHQIYTGEMSVVYFGDPENPQVLGNISEYPDQGYNHSGWLSDNGNYYVMADETYGMKLKMLDVSDLSDIEVLSVFGSEQSELSMAHNPIIKGDFVYISYYNDGLWIFDISNPANPQVAGYYDTFPLPQTDNYRGAWGVYPYLPSGNVLISDRQSGLFVFDVSDALNNVISGVENFDINEQSDNRVLCYPSVVEEQVRLQLPTNGNSIENTYQIQFINAKGVVNYAAAANSQNNQINIANIGHLSPGFYILQISNAANNEAYTAKIMKQ